MINTMDPRATAEQIFLAGVESVRPDRLMPKLMRVKDDQLVIGDLNFKLSSIRNIYVIGAGKASGMMAAEVEKILGNRIAEGHVVVKYGHACELNHIRVSEAGHPVPDSKGVKATEAILGIAEKAGDHDLVICLISGGGSALLADFPTGSSLEELKQVNDLLIKSGASIEDINTVRKHLSLVKGGQLAGSAYPASIVSLILSDVSGDLPDVIASGPTSPDPTTFHQALGILEKFSLLQAVPEAILNHLKKGESGGKPETPKPGDLVFGKVHNLIIGTNKVALGAAKQKALSFGIDTVIADDQLKGDIHAVAAKIVEMAVQVKEDKSKTKPLCLLFGGEPTIQIKGSGLGGRNQHLALLCASLIKHHANITILSAGTDGTDGPTDVAGAVVDSLTLPAAFSANADPLKYLETFDSWHFFKKTGGHIVTGPTLTNVMDIIVVIVQ